jgi:hypothetical protein
MCRDSWSVWDGQRGRSATGASHPGPPHRHSACRLAPVRWTAMVRLNQRYSWKPPARKQAVATARRHLRLSLDHGHFRLGERAGMLRGDRRPRAILVVLVRESNVEGQRREPATGSVRIATRRAGWRPFAVPDSSIRISGTPARLSHASGAWPLPVVIAISVWILVMSG